MRLNLIKVPSGAQNLRPRNAAAAAAFTLIAAQSLSRYRFFMAPAFSLTLCQGCAGCCKVSPTACFHPYVRTAGETAGKEKRQASGAAEFGLPYCLLSSWDGSRLKLCLSAASACQETFHFLGNFGSSHESNCCWKVFGDGCF